MLKKYKMTFGLLTLAVLLLSGCAATKVSLSGGDEPWLCVNKPDGTLSVLERLFGENNWVRIDDTADHLWMANSGATVRVVAEFTGQSQNLWVGSEELIAINSGSFISLTDGLTVNISQTGTFRFFNKSGGVNWSSLPSENPDLRDHLVTFKITNHGGVNYSIGDYIIAWEDLGVEGDYDYNDIVLLLHNIVPIAE